MKSEKFYNGLASFIKQNDIDGANSIIMNEIGTILVHDRNDFITLLNASGIMAEEANTDTELIQKFINNIGSNEKLRIGTAFLVAHKNKTLSFNGEEEVNDAGVKAMNRVIKSHFDSRNFPDSADNYYSNAGGPWATVAQEGLKFGSKIAEGQQKKKFGGIDAANKSADAKNEIVRAALKQRLMQQASAQKAAERSAKTKKIVLISVISIVGLAAIIGTIVYIKNKK